MFYFENLDGKKILKSDYIKEANAFFTTRDICICDKNMPPYGTIENSEETKQISKNKKLICNYLKIEERNFLSPQQTHSENIALARKDVLEYPDIDALILIDKSLGIFLNFADCTPIILYDEKQNTGAVAHAGWRGTAQKIAVKTVWEMAKKYGSKPEDIIAVIGPAIGFCCYNVGQEVYEQLSVTVSVFDKLFEIRQGNIYVDLKNINRQQLVEAGVKKIDVCPYCTIHNNDYFFSYRNENKTTKRHSAVLCLK